MTQNYPSTPKVREKLDSGAVSSAIERLAATLMTQYDFTSDTMAVVGIQTRGAILAQRIVEIINAQKNVTVPYGDINITLYRDDFSTVGVNPIVHETHLDFDVNGKQIVLIDDVLFTGRTVRAALDQIMDYGRPKGVSLAVLIDRGHRELPIQADFAAMQLKTKIEESVKLMLKEVDGQDEIIICEAINS